MQYPLKFWKELKAPANLAFPALVLPLFKQIFKTARIDAKWPLLITESFLVVRKQTSIENGEIPSMHTLLHEELKNDWAHIDVHLEEKRWLWNKGTYFFRSIVVCLKKWIPDF